jgi:hypothetical protein
MVMGAGKGDASLKVARKRTERGTETETERDSERFRKSLLTRYTLQRQAPSELLPQTRPHPLVVHSANVSNMG